MHVYKQVHGDGLRANVSVSVCGGEERKERKKKGRCG